MKHIFICLALFFMTLTFASAQEVVSYRISDLQDERYEIEGDAIIEQMSDGTSRFRLSEDYSTPWGPDVRVLLNTSKTTSGAFEVVNLTDINHFEGALTIALPADFDLEDYDFVLFFCINFNQFWASGQFGEVLGMSGSDCSTSSTFGASGVNVYDICPSGATGNVLSLSNSNNTPAGDEYIYIITDENEIVVDYTDEAFYDFGGSSTATNRVYGMSYDGSLNVTIGGHRLASNALNCFEHSNATEFLTVTKNACTASFVCEPSLTATTDWVTSADICPSDGADDIVELRNNLFIAPGVNYAYLITNPQGILQEITTDSTFNFEGSSEEEQRVYGIHYDGTLNPQIGQDRKMTTATGCFEHSGDNLFLTINKTACAYECVETLTATHNWVVDIDVCANDGQSDEVFLQNNVMIAPGANYVFLLTDVNEILQEVITDSIYNFENTGLEEQRVYGLSFAGELDAKIGENRKMTSADECFIHSGDDLFITINKTAACNTTSTVDAQLANQIEVYPNPSNGQVNIKYNDLNVQFDQVTIFDITGKKVKEVGNVNQVHIEEPGMYLIQFSNAEVTTTKKILIQ